MKQGVPTDDGSSGGSAPTVSGSQSWLGSRWLRSALFVLYALGLAVATHWPKLKLPGPEGLHPDKLLHIGAFALWAALLLASGLVGDWRRGRSQGLALLAAILAGAVDEAAQALPGLGREVSLWDAAANAGGAVLAVTIAAILANRTRRAP